MNTDKRGLKRIGLSAFIGVDRRLKCSCRTFSATSLAGVPSAAGIVTHGERRLKPAAAKIGRPTFVT
jgi:hypothetical protein